jgi:UDP-glucose 4-epimerase
MQILITGGAGFIGSNLVEYHLNKEDKVHALDDLSTGRLANIQRFLHHPNFQFTHTDILSCTELDAIVATADVIYHLAAIVGVLKIIDIPTQVLTTNIIITERLLRAAVASLRQPRVLLASSSEIYGEGNAQAFTESCPIVIGCEKNLCQSYIASKVTTEAYGLAYYRQYQLNVTNLRIFNTIGRGQIGGYGMVVPRFITQAVANQPLLVYGNGQQVRSFCDVRDVVVLMDLLVHNPHAYGKNINLGRDQAISILELAQLIKHLANSSSRIEHKTYAQVYGPAFEDILFRKPDLTLLLALTHYQFQWDLEMTLHDLIAIQRTS